ncbi:hypothetical protein PUN28_005485 [Cardiocondyla obscurior]|uniref:Protein I'm not dead yet n=1 Tax=Cardiocondyla obscurior TaxID=286306 RepID=A0AAW2GGR6_9HYME
MIDDEKAENKNVILEGRNEEESVDDVKNLINCLKRTGWFFKIYWKIIFALFWALFLLPLPLIYNYLEARFAYVVLLMSGYWISNCFPMVVTSLIPVVLFPALGILNTADTCACYMNDTIMVFVGSVILAIAIEHSNLHLRIVLGFLKATGCTHAKLLGGLCTITTLISMWVSNTATTAMMVPIIFAVLRELEQAKLSTMFETKQVDSERPDVPLEIRPTKITKAYLLAVAYCSTFGGTGTFVGTGTNLTFKGIYEIIFPEAEEIGFIDWMIASFPQMVINSFFTWLYLRVTYMGYLRPHSKDTQTAAIGREGEAVINYIMRQKYKNLGPLTFHEIGVATLFLLCAFLRIFRKSSFFYGWSRVITNVDVGDSVPGIFVCILMFFIPKDPNFIYCCSQDPVKRPKKSSEGLITWKMIGTKMPWSMIFLFGGGFAISKGSVASCMAKRFSDALVPLRYLPPVVILVIVCLFEGIITEFTSNIAVANITLPAIAQMCVAMEMHPMYLMIPATLMCSFSFRSSVGTPPNAIISVAGYIPPGWLIASGCVPAIYSLIVEIISFLTWGTFIFGIKDFPIWAMRVPMENNTNVC